MGETGASPADTTPFNDGLRFTWATIYTPAWDDDPGAYVTHGWVAWGYSRRLAKIVGDVRLPGDNAFKAYLGVRHDDPGRWGVASEPRAVYFLSYFLDGRTLALRTYPTLAEARAALRSAYTQIHAGQ